jgi:hypothetical protein
MRCDHLVRLVHSETGCRGKDAGFGSGKGKGYATRDRTRPTLYPCCSRFEFFHLTQTFKNAKDIFNYVVSLATSLRSI